MSTRGAVIAGNDVVLKAVQQERAAKAGINPEYETQFVLERDRDLPLRFWGDKIGSGVRQFVDDKGCDRGTEVIIYATSSGKIVTEVRQWTKRPIESESRSRRDAAAHERPEDALEWLKQDGKGSLGPASKTAWLEACETFEPLKSYAVEDVD